MTLARPNRSFRTGLPDAVEVQLVDVREVSPPAGQAGVHWRLLTTRPVGDAAEAWAIVELYRRCWAIEQLFRTQGIDIEGLRIEDPVPREKLATAALIAAVAEDAIDDFEAFAENGVARFAPLEDAVAFARQIRDPPTIWTNTASVPSRRSRPGSLRSKRRRAFL